MAKGYPSLHPLTEKVLRIVGIMSSDVTQGWGFAKASAGFHAPVGTCQGRRYSTCFDINSRWAHPLMRDAFPRLWAAGVIIFPRIGTPGMSNHLHCIHLGLRNDAGDGPLLSGPRAQIVDMLASPPRSGLARHGLLEGTCEADLIPPIQTRAAWREQYATWQADYPTIVTWRGNQITCYAWLEAGTVTCEVRAFCEWWGYPVEGHAGGFKIVLPDGSGWGVIATDAVFNGYNWRAPVRKLADVLGLACKFRWATDKLSARVEVEYR